MLGATGQSYSETFAVQDTGQPVRVTLAFTDAPGPLAGAAQVNDLNLTVDAGATYKGNVLAGGQSVPGGDADPRNNVESVLLPAGTSGSFSVQVTAANVAGNGVPGNPDATDQDFALVVSNAAQTTAPVLGDGATTVDDDGRLDPGDSFGISQQVRNSGNAPATGVAGSLSGSSLVSVDDGSAAWPNILPGASAANSDPLSGSVTASAVCGAPLAATLEVTSAEGSALDLPVPLATGSAGAPVQHDSAHVPRPIPDGDPDGVESTLAVQPPGRIKDVNVRIGSLTHTWVGDLTIDVVAPDGTEVRLASRPGGVDNSANNLTNVVFDDEAAAPIGEPTGSNPAYTGAFRPQADQLSRLDGKEQQGFWTLRVNDLVSEDAGSIVSWGAVASPANCGGAGAQPPGQVGDLAVEGGAGSVELEWSDVAQAGGYQVFRRRPDGGYSQEPVATPAASQYTDPDQPAGTACYRVRAVSANGSGPLSAEECTTVLGPPPGSITGLTAAGGEATVTLDWDDLSTATEFDVFRRDASGAYPGIPTATVFESRYVDTGRIAGSEECYRVRARNGVGEGPLSGEACASATDPERPVLPKLDLSGVPRSVRVGRRGVFRVAFDGTPAEEGIARVVRRGRRLATRRFIVDNDGSIALRMRLNRRRLARLRKVRRLGTRLRVSLGDLSASRRLTLRAPRRGQ